MCDVRRAVVEMKFHLRSKCFPVLSISVSRLFGLVGQQNKIKSPKEILARNVKKMSVHCVMRSEVLLPR